MKNRLGFKEIFELEYFKDHLIDRRKEEGSELELEITLNE